MSEVLNQVVRILSALIRIICTQMFQNFSLLPETIKIARAHRVILKYCILVNEHNFSQAHSAQSLTTCLERALLSRRSQCCCHDS